MEGELMYAILATLLTLLSALDIFGGEKVKFADLVKWNTEIDRN